MNNKSQSIAKIAAFLFLIVIIAIFLLYSASASTKDTKIALPALHSTIPTPVITIIEPILSIESTLVIEPTKQPVVEQRVQAQPATKIQPVIKTVQPTNKPKPTAKPVETCPASTRQTNAARLVGLRNQIRIAQSNIDQICTVQPDDPRCNVWRNTINKCQGTINNIIATNCY